MIYVVSHPKDAHANAVLEHLSKMDEPARLVNLNDFPLQRRLTIDYAVPTAPSMSSQNGTLNAWDFGEAKSIWWRRPQSFSVPEMPNSDVHAFTYNEWDEAASGLWQLLPGTWINDPTLDRRASRKAFQLREAALAGLRIPRTMITSDADQARKFVKALGIENTIYKVFSATQGTWRETRRLRESELSFFDSLDLAPVIFQECIDAEIDLRITVVGDQLFPAAIIGQGTYDVDFRMEMDNARIEPAKLPKKLIGQLLAFMRRLGLVYGAIDMRKTADGDYIFLEVNTAGQWLFVEYETGQPIAQAVADALAKPKDIGNLH